MTVKVLASLTLTHPLKSNNIPRLNTSLAVALLVACFGLYLVLRPVMPDDTHSHPHSHGHSHDHEGGHDYSQAHVQGGNAEGDTWDGEKYTEFPGLQEIALASGAGVRYALSQSTPSPTEPSLSGLEIGCGAGAVTPHLSPLFTSIHAIDTSPSMLRAFSRSPAAALSNVTWSQHALSPLSAAQFDNGSGDLQVSPTPDEPGRMVKPPTSRFDVAVTNLVLHHVDDIPAFLAGARGLLKSGGRLIVTEFGQDPTGSAREGEGQGGARVVEHKVTPEGSVNAAHHHHAAWTPQEMVHLLEENGFVNCHAEIRGTLPVINVPSLVAWGSIPA